MLVRNECLVFVDNDGEMGRRGDTVKLNPRVSQSPPLRVLVERYYEHARRAKLRITDARNSDRRVVRAEWQR